MNFLKYSPLELKNKCINRWLVCGIYEKNMKFTPVTMEGDINRWLIEGFSINENPCRKEFIEKRRNNIPYIPSFISITPGQAYNFMEQEKKLQIYFPWGNPNVELSNFWYVPTYLCSFAVTYIQCSSSHRAKLNLRTCGGMTLWINKNFITDFTPYKRNIENQKEIEVELNEGLNEFIVCFDDLAERDTMYYFRIDYAGDQDIKIVLPSGEGDTHEIVSIEESLDSAYFMSDTVRNGPVILNISNKLNKDIKFYIKDCTKHGADGNKDDNICVTLKKDENFMDLGDSCNFRMGFNYINIGAYTGSIYVNRIFGIQIYNDKNIHFYGIENIKERKKAALYFIAKYGEPDVYRALAMLRTGGDVNAAGEIILRQLTGINERRDCSDFYLAGILIFWYEYRDRGIFNEDFWERIKNCILNYRYWIDEPGDDVMWFFSENHALLFHVCELLAGDIFPEEIFTNSNKNGKYHSKKAEDMLESWLERFFDQGLAEWNSSAYIPIDVLGLITALDYAKSEKIKKYAKQALDLIYYYIALISHKGIMASTYGRCYEKDLKGHLSSGTSFLCWIGYGVGYINNHTIGTTVLCLSQYFPPDEYKKFITLDNLNGYFFKYEQGIGGYAKIYNFKTKNFNLSSVYNFRPGHKGYQEHVIEGVISPEAHVFINHPGQIHLFGNGRPSFWAGNGYLPKIAQYKGLGILLYRIGHEHDADYTHSYMPIAEFERCDIYDNWIFAQKNGVYVGLYAANRLYIQDKGPDKNREVISKGYKNIWLLRMADNNEFDYYEKFVQTMLNMKIDIMQDQKINVFDPVYGKVSFGWDEILKINDTEAEFKGCGVRGRIEYI